MLRQALVFLALLCPASSAVTGSASQVELRILAINDLHGYLQPFPAEWAAPLIGYEAQKFLPSMWPQR